MLHGPCVQYEDFTPLAGSTVCLYCLQSENMLPKSLIPRLHDRANIEQTSSKRRANIEQIWSMHTA